MTLNSVVIQNLTYTETSLGNLPTITYTNDGIAGSEVVTVSGSPANISVSIQSGVSIANQIKAAVQANFLATRLVTVTGSSTAAQVSCVNAALTGGTALSTATLVVGGVLKLTAASSGTAGNAVTLVLTPGATAGSEVVSVISNAITAQIADGVTTWDQLVTAYNLVSAATSLATLSSAGPALSGSASQQVSIGPVPAVFSSPEGVVNVAMLPTATHLAGGAALVAASLVNQGVTYTAFTAGTAANAARVTLVNDGTAGSETFSETATSLIVHIQSGTSTVTQIVSALSTSTFYVVTGSASTHPLTVNQASMSGGSPASWPPVYYVDQGIFKTKEQA